MKTDLTESERRNKVLILRLALRNIYGTGIRMWLNILVIAFSLIAIIFAQAMYDGLTTQMIHSMVTTEIAGGQFYAEGFDPNDPFTFDRSARTIPVELKKMISSGTAVPVLYSNATLYSKGRSIQVHMKGILPEQSLLSLPTRELDSDSKNAIPVLIGKRMLKILKLKKGDQFTLKWRDSKGVFDAQEFYIAQLMDTVNPRVDSTSVWVSYRIMEKFMACKYRASLITVKNRPPGSVLASTGMNNWTFHSQEDLVNWVKKLIESDRKYMRIIFALLLFLCSIGIFNSQILSVYKRKKEIGTLMALGMRKANVIRLFTLEGILMTIIGIAGAGILGFPIFYWSATSGIPMGHTKGMGMPVPEKLFFHYSTSIVISAVAVVFLLMTIVSWFPVRKISSMEPAKALSGRK